MREKKMRGKKGEKERRQSWHRYSGVDSETEKCMRKKSSRVYRGRDVRDFRDTDALRFAKPISRPAQDVNAFLRRARARRVPSLAVEKSRQMRTKSRQKSARAKREET